MKELTNYFSERNILFKTIEKIEPKQLGSRKKMDIYTATAVDKNYYAIFILNAKSRFLIKNAKELEQLLYKLSEHQGHNFKKPVLLIGSPLCSKAKAYLKESGWSVKIDFV